MPAFAGMTFEIAGCARHFLFSERQEIIFIAYILSDIAFFSCYELSAMSFLAL